MKTQSTLIRKSKIDSNSILKCKLNQNQFWNKNSLEVEFEMKIDFEMKIHSILFWSGNRINLVSEMKIHSNSNLK